jgi:hypothetical protein
MPHLANVSARIQDLKEMKELEISIDVICHVKIRLTNEFVSSLNVNG